MTTHKKQTNLFGKNFLKFGDSDNLRLDLLGRYYKTFLVELTVVGRHVRLWQMFAKQPNICL